MKAPQLDLVNLDPNRQSIDLDTRRILQWDADAFGDLRKDLIDSVGLDRARAMLQRFGFSSGFRDGSRGGDWWRSCPGLQHGEARPGHVLIDRHRGAFEMEVTWLGSFEAGQHLRAFDRPAEPVCWSVVGYASGFSSALIGEECYVVEQECVALGSDCCRVIGKTRRGWGDAGDEHASRYAQNGTPGISFGDVMPMERVEQLYILEVLERFEGNRTHTARALGIGANTLWRKLKAWGVPPARSS